MRIPHTSCHRGKRVKVVLKNGTEVIGRFENRTDKWIVLKDVGRINKADIRAFIILKGEQ